MELLLKFHNAQWKFPSHDLLLREEAGSYAGFSLGRLTHFAADDGPITPI